MTLNDVLFIRHIPICMSKSDVEDFLKHMGAQKVTVFESKFKKHTAFATFKNEYVATECLHRLHQKDIFGSKLVVEFAKNHQRRCNEPRQDIPIEKEEDETKMKLYETFLQNLNAWMIGLNFKLPPPHHLRYKYPSPSPEVLLNITNVLTYSTKFYTQVLHLMNRMNLPCPFDETFPLQQNDVFSSYVNYIVENSVFENPENQLKSSSGDETELESDEEIKLKKNLSPKKLPVKKSIKRKITLKNVIDVPLKSRKMAPVEEVFEKVKRGVPTRKIEVKMPTKIVSDHSRNITDDNSQDTEIEVQNANNFGIIYPTEKSDLKKEPDKEEQIDVDMKHISAEELAMNRISEKSRKELPVFKNYQAGTPSCRLYIKNLSKDVTVQDLNYIFKRYFVSGIDEQGTMFDIRLMQEGRMKGQAFVTLQNQKQAELALKETNAFILKNKPMVVQFARSALSSLVLFTMVPKLTTVETWMQLDILITLRNSEKFARTLIVNSDSLLYAEFNSVFSFS